MKKTLIIGSNGSLGRYIVDKAIDKLGVKCLVLADYKPERLTKLAEKLTKKTGEKVTVKEINIYSRQSIKKGLENISNVIIALQQKEPLIQEVCISRGINTIDLSVNKDFISQTLTLKKDDRSIHLLAAGLFPGLSGILTKDLCKKDELIDVGLLQSINGSNGSTGVSDMLNIFNEKVTKITSNDNIELPGFSDKKEFHFENNTKNSKLRLCNFIERDFLIKDNIRCNFYTGFDNEILNKIIYMMKKTGIFNLLKYKRAEKIITSLIANENSNSPDQSIGICVRSKSEQKNILLKSDYEATASCAISYLQLLAEKDVYGIKFPFEIFNAEEVLERIPDVII